jgi:DNA-binding LacI/PurR family transcriptional regulator
MRIIAAWRFLPHTLEQKECKNLESTYQVEMIRSEVLNLFQAPQIKLLAHAKGEGSRSTMCLKTADSRGLGEARQHLVEMEKVNEHIACAQPGERIIPSQKKIAELAAYAAELAEHNANPSSCWTP